MATMGEPQSAMSILELFAQLEDPRVDRTKGYQLDEILFLVLCGVLSGLNYLTDIEDFGNAKLEWLRQFLPYENGIPSHDTLGRVLGMLNPDALEQMFASWMAATSAAVEGVVAIDGKTLRGAIKRGNSRSFVHMVSAFASANSVVLGQVKTAEKSNEIEAIPRLLELLHLEGAIVTIDAIGCQHTILDQIVAAGGDYVVAVKKNQPTLYHDVSASFEEVDEAQSDAFLSTGETSEKGHGRVEHRVCQTLCAENMLEDAEKWKSAKTLIRVTSKRTARSSDDTSCRLFISSIPELDAAAALKHVRSHWLVENNLHWSLDVSFREDDCRVCAENAAENLVVVRHIALNLLRSVQGLSGGVASKRQKCAYSDDAREKVLCAGVK